MDLHASQIQGFFDIPVDKCVSLLAPCLYAMLTLCCPAACVTPAGSVLLPLLRSRS